MFSTSRIYINLSAIGNNFQAAQAYSNCTTAAVIKANSYGLNANLISNVLYQRGCRHFFSATLAEAIQLRTNFYQQDVNIYLLNGVLSNMISACKQYNIIPICSSVDQARNCAQANMVYFMHTETGLQRLGSSLEEILSFSSEPAFAHCKGLLSQLVFSEEENHAVSKKQYELMLHLKQQFPHLCITSANSGGLNHKADKLFDMIRIGRMLYGTCDNRFANYHQIQDVIHWQAQILHIKHIEANRGVGYGHHFISQHPMKIGILGAGYEDGIPIGASMRNYCANFNHKPLPFIGRIAMDLTALDITNTDDLLQTGSWVDIIGGTASTLDQASALLQLNPRFILTSLGQRVEKLYYYK